jgi:hypothetical protein
MDKFTELNSRMIVLRNEFDRLCKKPRKTIDDVAYEEVCNMMFIGLTYGITEHKLDELESTITRYRNK